MEFVIILGVAIVLFGSIFLLVHLMKLRSQHAAEPDEAPPNGPQPDPEMVKRALKLVWVDCYGMDLAQAPRIVFATGTALDCYNGMGWNDPKQGCVGGLSWEATRTCRVAYYPGVSMSVLAFAHELWHAKTWLDGTDDPKHIGPGFAPGGPVELANRALFAGGY